MRERLEKEKKKYSFLNTKSQEELSEDYRDISAGERTIFSEKIEILDGDVSDLTLECINEKRPSLRNSISLEGPNS